jgi:hypothetical protein
MKKDAVSFPYKNEFPCSTSLFLKEDLDESLESCRRNALFYSCNLDINKNKDNANGSRSHAPPHSN